MQSSGGSSVSVCLEPWDTGLEHGDRRTAREMKLESQILSQSCEEQKRVLNKKGKTISSELEI